MGMGIKILIHGNGNGNGNRPVGMGGNWNTDCVPAHLYLRVRFYVTLACSDQNEPPSHAVTVDGYFTAVESHRAGRVKLVPVTKGNTMPHLGGAKPRSN